MNKFGYRLRFYIIGFGLGCVMVWAMFYRNNDRRLSTPQGLIFNFIEQLEEVQMNEKANCQIACYGLQKGFLNKDFLKEADVDFSESATKRQPCPEYVITSTLPDKRSIKIYIETCLNPCEGCDESDKKATLRSVEILGEEKKCDC